MSRRRRVIITGAAGLVGQNLATLLADRDDLALVALDKHEKNLALLSTLHPHVEAVCCDLSVPGDWQAAFQNARVVIQLHAQITGSSPEIFERNNIAATTLVLDAMRRAQVPYLIHVSSSVVNSAADDDYTRTKKRQEQMVRDSGIKHCVLRPTLMFGWFDPKHLGWLSRFMERVPVFPIPGDGRYMRQPLYVMDFCRAIEVCLDRQPDGAIYDLVGPERIDYIDIIRAIRHAKVLKTPIVPVPVWLFTLLLRTYGLFTKRPPFTAEQLKALTAGDEFTGVDIRETFGFEPTPFRVGIEETFRHPLYSKYTVERV